MHEAMRQNEYYAAHRHRLQKIRESVAKEPPFDTSPSMKKMAYEKERTRAFEKAEETKTLEEANIRMLGRFIEIQSGKELAVAPRNPKDSITYSPVIENHSLHLKAKLDAMHELNRQNQSFLERIRKVEAKECKMKDLENHWAE